MGNIDLSGTFANVFEFLISAFSNIVDLLDSIYIFRGVSILTFFIVLVILGMIISSVFVLFSGDVDD